MDNHLNLKGSWEEVREKLKENDIRLTDDDLDYQPGQEGQLLDRLAKKIGKTQAAVKEYIESISFNTHKSG